MKKIIDTIQKFYKKNNFQKAIIGLSGGIDSSVTAALLVKSLGKDNVLGVYLPCGNQNDISDVKALCKLLKIKFLVIDISPAFIAINKVLNNHDKLVKANITSRLRMVHLYALANQNKGFVCGTTNKAEYALGYFTKFGDGACDFEPLLHLFKSEIYKLGQELKIPQSIMDKAPSAGLWPNQTDEGDMGVTYQEIEKYLKNQKISENSKKIIEKLIKNSAHKRVLPFAI
jgi:NAD+ synthase